MNTMKQTIDDIPSPSGSNILKRMVVNDTMKEWARLRFARARWNHVLNYFG